MRFIRRATQRAASLAAAIASVFLLATCDLDKILNVDTTKAVALDSTDLALSITGGPDLTLGATATVSVTASAASGADLTQTTKEFTSSDTTVISVLKATGVMTGVKIGTAKITARILAPELGSGVTRSQNVRVRYKGIKVMTPTVPDSITGLGFTRAVTIQGTNALGTVVAALTADSIRSRDTTVVRMVGANASARKNGTSYVVAFFDGFRDSVAVRVRRVAKSITFPTTDYTARHLNFNLTVPATVKDIADSVIVGPTATWRVTDTTVATIGATTGALRLKKIDTTRVFAKVDTVERGQKIVVAQVVASLAKDQGDARSDTVAKAVTVVPAVTALDSGSTAVAGASVLFRPGVGLNATVTDSVQITGASGQAMPTAWKLGDVAGINNTLVATSGAATTTFTVTAIAGAPKKLVFTVQPTLVASATAIAPAVKVVLQDSLGNTATTATDSVTISLSANPSAATLGGTRTVAAVAGIATFTDLTVNAGGSGYTLQASSGTLTAAISDAFDVYGAAAKLAFVTQPTNVTTGTAMTPAVRVAVQDALGSTVASSTATVTLSLSTNPGAATLGGTVSVAAVGGIATFSTLTLNQVGTGYVLQAAATGLTSATSSAFNAVTVGAASKLAFTVQPSNVGAGAANTPSIQVTVQDAAGATVTSSTASITLAIDPTANPGSATLGGTVTVSASAGVATFSNVTLNKAGTGYKLTASAFSLTSATSNTFNVTPGLVTNLGFIQPPTHTVAGQTMAPAVTVALRDANFNTVTTAAATSVTLTLTGCSATLAGTTTASSASGIATFSNLSIATQVSNCTLVAAATGLTPATSTAFNSVAATGALRLRFVTTPSATTAGFTIGSVQVEVIDGSTPPVRVTTASASITVSVGSGPGNFSSGTTTATTSAGVATFSSLVLQKSGSYTLAANATGYPAATSSSFAINPGSFSSFAFRNTISNVLAGATITPAIEVGVVDFYGNVITSATNTISVDYWEFPSGALSLQGTLSRVAVAGIATFNDLKIRSVGTGYKLYAFGATCCPQSNAFDAVAGPPVALGFKVQPPISVNAGATISPSVEVRIEDAAGNPVASATTPISVALTGGATGAVLSGTKTVTPASGVATFSDLKVDKPGTSYALSASASGFTTTPSSFFTVNVGPASKLVLTSQPTNTTGGGSFNITVSITDDAGNVVTNDNRTINLAIQTGTGTTGAALSGTTSVFSSSGVATFNNITIDKVGTGYKIRAFALFGGLTDAISDAFDVALGPKAKLTITDQPTNSNGGATISPAVKVAITDQGGNLIATATDSVTIAITQFTGSSLATLSGTKKVAAVAGVATFSTLSIDKNANSYSLTATAAGLAAATSSSFNVIVGPKAKLVVQSQPTSVTSLSTFTVQIAVADAGGNTVTSATDIVTIGIKSGTGVSGAVLGGNLTLAAVSGVATFNTLTVDKAGAGYQFTATSGTLTAATSSNMTVNPGSPTKHAWITQPTATFVNAPLVPSGQLPQIAILDASNNTVNTSSSTYTVRIAVSVGPTTTFKSSGSNVTQFDIVPVSGIATIPSTVTMGTAGTYTLRATSPFAALTLADASPFTATAFDVKSKVGFIQQPTSAGYGIAIAPAITAAIQDQYGNTVTTATDNITLALGTDANPTTTLSGGGATAAVAGVATFSGVTLNKTGTGYTLIASASGLASSAASSSFTISSPGIVQSSFAYDMVKLGTTIYYLDGSNLKSVPSTGGTATTITAVSSPKGITTDGTNIFWIEGSAGTGLLRKYNVSSTAVTTLATGLADTYNYANTLASDGTNVYFHARNAGGTGTAIRSISVNGGAVTDLFSVAFTGYFLPFTVSGGFIYFSDQYFSAIKRMTTAGGSVTTLATGQTAWLLVLSGTTLLYTDYATTTDILSIANANTISSAVVPTTVLSGTTAIYNWTLDGSNLYADFSNVLRKYNVSSFASFTSMSTSLYGYYTSMPVDATDVYFLTGSSTIAKIPK